jgi:predicted regulator of Ras-like GTPase activity (Roadblock/LC7/MglB family)
LSWFHDITRHPNIDVALLVDGMGKLVATSNRIGSEAQRVASMIKAAEVLARGLSAALGRGDMHTLQLSTRAGHLLVIPIGTAYYLIVLTTKNAPMDTIADYLQDLVAHLSEEEMLEMTQRPKSLLDDLDINELISEVVEWLAEQRSNRV